MSLINLLRKDDRMSDGTQYIFETVLYTAIRDEVVIDLKNIVAELNIFEDLNKSYLTGSIVLVDDTGVMSDVKIKGDEGLRIIISKNPNIGEYDSYFQLDFKVVSIVRQFKNADRSEVYSLNLISKHAYDNSVVKISKSFSGKLEKISESILKNFLGVKLLMDEKYYDAKAGSNQEPIKILLPYLSPLESVDWLTERATDRWGTPFFIWASIWGQDMSEDTSLRLGNFMTMVKEGINVASTKPPEDDFIYDQVTTNVKSSEGYEGAKRIIKNLKFSNIENTLKMVKEGAVGSTIANLDTYTSQNISKLFSANKLLESLNAGEKGGKILSTVYDQKDVITLASETKLTGYWSARQRNTVSSYGTYASHNSIHDAIDESSLLNKVRPLSIRSMLSRNMLEINIDGIGLLEEKLSVGDIIKVRFLSADTDPDVPVGSNTERGGFYLIQSVRHIFGIERHNAVVFISKVAETDIVDQ